MTIYAQDIIDQALQMVEMTNAYSTTGFADRNTVQGWFNKGLSRLHYAIANADNTWFNSYAPIPVTAGTPQYALPNGTLYSNAAPFYRAINVFLNENSRIYALKKYNYHEMDGWVLLPPTRSATIGLSYIPAYQPIAVGDWTATGTHPSISTQYPPGFEDYVAAFIARRLAIKDNDLERAQLLQQEATEDLAEVLQRATVRDQYMPERVQDVTSRWSPPKYVLDSLNPPFYYRLFGDYLQLGQPDTVL